jgi:hypothetical protein
MHEETKREVIQEGSNLLGSILKELLVHRNRVNVLEQQKEKELELAEARDRAAARHDEPSPGDQRHHQEPVETGVASPEQRVHAATPSEIEAALDELIEEEMCEVCRELLVALKERPARQQVRGVMEYGTFKSDLSEGAGVEELKATIRQTDVLHDVFQEKYTSQGTQP